MEHNALNAAIDNINVFVGALCFVIAFSHSLARNKQYLNYIIILIYTAYGFGLLCFSLEASGKMIQMPHLFAVSWPVQQVFHIAFFLYVTLLKNPMLKPRKRHLYYFLPSLLLFIVSIPMIYLKSPEEKIKMILEYNSWGNPLFMLIFLYALLVNLSFVGMSIAQVLPFWGKAKKEKASTLRIVFVILVFGIAADLILFVGLATHKTLLVRIDSLLIDLLICAPFFLSIRYPDFMRSLSVEISKEKYRQSQIKGLNVDSIITRLNELMRLEKIYTDPELDIDSLSEVLRISKHQLSEILNNVLKKDFKNYINDFRVEEAKELLVNNSEDGILQVAYGAGFNSKTAFYTAFTKNTGLTPTEYRQKWQKKQ